MSRAWFTAAHSGDVCTLRSLMDVYAGSTDENGDTALLIAIRGGHLNAVQLLAVHEISVKNHKGVSPLLASVYSRRLDMVHILIRNPQLLIIEDMDRAIEAAHKEGVFEDILTHTRRIVVILNESSSMLSTKSSTSTSLAATGTGTGLASQGPAGTMHNNMNTLLGRGLETPQLNLNLNQSVSNRRQLRSSSKLTRNKPTKSTALRNTQRADLTLASPAAQNTKHQQPDAENMNVLHNDTINNTLSASSIDGCSANEYRNTSTERAGTTEPAKASPPALLAPMAVRQDPAGSLPMDLSGNLSVSELNIPGDNLDQSSQREETEPLQSMENANENQDYPLFTMSPGVAKQISFPIDLRTANITPCARSTRGNDQTLSQLGVSAISIRDYSPRFRKTSDMQHELREFLAPGAKLDQNQNWSQKEDDTGKPIECSQCREYIEQITTMQATISTLEANTTALYQRMKGMSVESDKWSKKATALAEDLKKKQKYISTLEERIAKIASVSSQDAQRRCSEVDAESNTGLMMCALSGNIQGIYSNISQANQRNSYNQTALMFAAMKNHPDIVTILAPLEARQFCTSGKTALMYAAEANAIECINILLGFERQMQSPAVDLVESLRESNKKISVSGRTALMIAAKHNSVQAARILLDEEAGMRMSNGVTALMIAISKGNEQIAHMLLLKESGIETEEGDFALRRAVHKRMRALIPTLIYAEEALMNSIGWTPTMIYTMINDLELVKQHVVSDCGKRDINGTTALMISVRLRLTPLTKFLAAKECGIMDSQGRTALIIAIQMENISAIKALAPFEKNINSLSGLTPADYIQQKSQYKKRIKEILSKAAANDYSKF